MIIDREHKAAPQPDDINIPIWRYLNFDKFNWMICNKRLFMSSADRLGDPLEGTQPVGDKKWWKNKIENVESEEERRILIDNSRILSKFTKCFRPNYFVSCWHMNKYENQCMWKFYTKSSDSVAIQTKYSILSEQLPGYTIIGLVRYIDYQKDRLPSLNRFELIMHKNKFFNFECEARAVVLSPPKEASCYAHFTENHFMLDSDNTFLFFAPSIDITKFVERVVLHPNATQTFKEKITNICNKNNLPPPINSKF